jgi:DNA-binding transcriptional LysR family regulator
LQTSQSAVSHTLDKLREAFKDPLFIHVGHGIELTTRALSLCISVEIVLANLESLTYDREFNPQAEAIEFTIATNDFPLGLIFTTLLKEFYAEGVTPQLNFTPARPQIYRCVTIPKKYFII